MTCVGDAIAFENYTNKQTKKLRDYKLNFPKAKLKFVTEFKVKYPPKERKIKQRDKKGGEKKNKRKKTNY